MENKTKWFYRSRMMMMTRRMRTVSNRGLSRTQQYLDASRRGRLVSGRKDRPVAWFLRRRSCTCNSTLSPFDPFSISFFRFSLFAFFFDPPETPPSSRLMASLLRRKLLIRPLSLKSIVRHIGKLLNFIGPGAGDVASPLHETPSLYTRLDALK